MFSIIKNIAKHSVLYGLSNILSRAIGFLLIPLYTHYLTPSDYGILELLDLTSYIVGLFLAMGIAQSVVRFYYEYDSKEKRHQVISVALITLWVVCGIVLVALFFSSRQISNLVFRTSEYYQMFNIIFLSMVIGLSNEIPLTILRIEEKSVAYVSISLAKLVMTLTLNILFIVKFNMGILGILYSGLISTAIMGVLITIFTLRYIKLSYSFTILRSMLSYGIPLIGSWFGMFIINFGDRFFLERLASLSDVGIYSLAYKFGMMPNVLILSPFLLIWAPKRFDLLKEPNAKDIFSKVFTYFIFIEIFVSLGLAVLIKEIIHVVADVQFHDAYLYVPVILIAYIMNGVNIYVQFGTHIEKKTKYLAYAALMSAVINVAGNFILIPIMGIWGAAISTLISFSFLMAFNYVPSQRLYYIKYETGRIIQMTVTAVVLYFAAVLIPLENLIISVAIKTIIVLSFPFILYVMKFYTEEEISRIKSSVKLLIGFAFAKAVPKKEV